MEVKLSSPIVVPPKTLPYLYAQRGAISDFKADAQKWLNLYHNQLQREWASFEAFLPEHCHSLLDVGSGCSGISVLFHRHFNHDLEVTVLDGIDDEPHVTKHASTFANFAICSEFLKANGMKRIRGIDAKRLPVIAPTYWDVVISQKSWCFHYEPATYLQLVKSGCLSDTVVIVDMRRDKPEWLDQMRALFKHMGTAYESSKYSTEVFRGTR